MLENLNAIWSKPEAFAQVVAASIGVVGLAITFLITYFKTKAFQKSEKIAEARLTIYLDLVEKYTAYTVFIWSNIKRMDSESVKHEKLNYFVSFLTACNKTYLVCTSKNKDVLDLGFTEIFKINKAIEEFGVSVEERCKLVNSLERKAVEMSLILRNELGVLSNKDLEVEIINRNYE